MCRNHGFQQMNEERLPTWKLKTRQPRADGGGAEAARRNTTGCSALRVQLCPLPPRPLPRAEDPPTPATAAGAGPGPGEKPKARGGHQARSHGTAPRSAWKGQKPQRGFGPRALRPPYYKPGVGEGVGRGWRDGRWTQEPLPPPASNLAVAGVSFPAKTRRPPPSPHLQGRCGARG